LKRAERTEDRSHRAVEVDAPAPTVNGSIPRSRRANSIMIAFT
jgi:hypothetical protein